MSKERQSEATYLYPRYSTGTEEFSPGSKQLRYVARIQMSEIEIFDGHTVLNIIRLLPRVSSPIGGRDRLLHRVSRNILVFSLLSMRSGREHTRRDPTSLWSLLEPDGLMDLLRD